MFQNYVLSKIYRMKDNIYEKQNNGFELLISKKSKKEEE